MNQPHNSSGHGGSNDDMRPTDNNSNQEKNVHT